MLDTIVDQLLIRRGYYDAEGMPRLATGAIVFGGLIRTLLVMFLGFAIWYSWGIEYSIPISLVLLWGFAVYPAYRQFVVFSEHTHMVEQELLCSSCRHYNESGQFCQLYDEHVRPDSIPCGGDDWEPS